MPEPIQDPAPEVSVSESKAVFPARFHLLLFAVLIATFLVHEFAHYSTHISTRRWTQPHGPVWKEEYWRLMRPFMSREVFPADVLAALENHLTDAPASSCTDHELMRMLRRHDRDPGFSQFQESYAQE